MHYSVTTTYVGIAEVVGGCVYQAIFNKDQAIVIPTCYEERGLLFLCGILSGVRIYLILPEQYITQLSTTQISKNCKNVV